MVMDGVRRLPPAQSALAVLQGLTQLAQQLAPVAAQCSSAALPVAEGVSKAAPQQGEEEQLLGKECAVLRALPEEWW